MVSVKFSVSVKRIEISKEKFSDDESFKIEFDTNEEIKPREEKREVMPIEENDPEKRKLKSCGLKYCGSNFEGPWVGPQTTLAQKNPPSMCFMF